MTPPLALRAAAEVRPEPARVVARLFLPGEELHAAQSRAREIVARVMALSAAEVERLVDATVVTFRERHRNYSGVLSNHAAVVASHVHGAARLSPARTQLLGASFTSEYSVEGAAVCNPSAVLHPDQSALDEGQLRIAISLRAIGEGHVSSIEFCTAIIGPGDHFAFAERPFFASTGAVSQASWQREHLKAVLDDQGELDELAHAVVQALPLRFAMADFERTVAETHQDLLSRSGASDSLHAVRSVISSAYTVEFTDDVPLDERVIMPWAPEESNGMEDARFTRFVDDDGAVEYRATYTAYDGHRIAPRLLTSPDLRTFAAFRLAGPAARNKGMALFPRLVDGRHLALCRTDGESISVASSPDGFVWSAGEIVHRPTEPWEALQVGNCGPPIETDRGWLVLTHGVGAMRTYSIGAILLDLEDPRIVRGRLTHPLLVPNAAEQDGYVPNVVYSCGGIVHEGTLWLPYGIGDARIGVASLRLDEVLEALSPRIAS